MGDMTNQIWAQIHRENEKAKQRPTSERLGGLSVGLCIFFCLAIIAWFMAQQFAAGLMAGMFIATLDSYMRLLAKKAIEG